MFKFILILLCLLNVTQSTNIAGSLVRRASHEGITRVASNIPHAVVPVAGNSLISTLGSTISSIAPVITVGTALNDVSNVQRVASNHYSNGNWCDGVVTQVVGTTGIIGRYASSNLCGTAGMVAGPIGGIAGAITCGTASDLTTRYVQNGISGLLCPRRQESDTSYLTNDSGFTESTVSSFDSLDSDDQSVIANAEIQSNVRVSYEPDRFDPTDSRFLPGSNNGYTAGREIDPIDRSPSHMSYEWVMTREMSDISDI